MFVRLRPTWSIERVLGQSEMHNRLCLKTKQKRNSIISAICEAMTRWQHHKIPFLKVSPFFSVIIIMNVCMSAGLCILWHACRSGKAFGSWFSYFQCVFLGSNSGLKACMVGAFTKWAISPFYNASYFSSFVIKVYVYAHVEMTENLCGINSILPNIKLRLPGLWRKSFNQWAIL